MFERIQKMKKSRAIVFDFPFSFRYIFTSFCSRTFWNTALESLWKDESKDLKTFKNRTPTKRAAWVRVNIKIHILKTSVAEPEPPGPKLVAAGVGSKTLAIRSRPKKWRLRNTIEKKTVCNLYYFSI